ncbi:MAG: hypothetical protein D6761_10785 [Candidatus Dadabacteria bacterium]|nr:MAG: hypothetical protein D6761_10785 [Candidatus Dadabacteria bacterium]
MRIASGSAVTSRGRLAEGAREYLLERGERLGDLFRIVETSFREAGARRVIPTTLIPLADIEDPDHAIVFTEAGTGRTLALRQDLTPLVARIVRQELAHLTSPYKLYYIERVWQSRSVGSRAREQIQAGCEWIGFGPERDGDVLALATTVARQLTDRPLTLVLGDARLRAAWQAALTPADPRTAEAALDARNLSLWQNAGDPAWPDLPLLTIDPGNVPPLPDGVRELVDELVAVGRPLADQVRVVIDPVAPAPHDYYTGMWFQVLSGIEHDPWLRGGRYDQRYENGRPAVGFAIDLDAVVEDCG